jgi:RNA polymerase sigma-70 factor (ECF subfamily)
MLFSSNFAGLNLVLSSMISFEIENIKSGNIAQYKQMFKRYYKPLVYFSYRYVKDVQIAEDIIQDVFVNIWNKRETLDFSLNFKSYLFSSVKNHSLMHINKTSKYEHVNLKLVTEKSENNPDTIIESAELEKTLNIIITELPEKRREIFCMSRFDKLTYSEIAVALSISVNTVETQMSRALKYIRKRTKSLFR